MKKLALLGAARPNYQEKVKNVLDRCGYCWSEWTYRIHPSKKEILDKQDSFYVYIHDIKNPKDKSRGKGTGLVNYKLLVRKSNYKYYDTPDKSPEPECTPPSNRLHRLYVKIIDEPIPILSRKWNTFKDFDKEVPLFQLKVLYPFIGPDVYFLYVIDENI